MSTKTIPTLELSVKQVGEVAVNAIQRGHRDFADGGFEAAARSFETAAHCCHALAADPDPQASKDGH